MENPTPVLFTEPTTVLLTKEQTAERLGNVSIGTLAVWRSKKRYNLPYIKVGALIRYRLSDVEDFIRRRTVGGPVEDAATTKPKRGRGRPRKAIRG
jgi:hypothetical protein